MARKTVTEHAEDLKSTINNDAIVSVKGTTDGHYVAITPKLGDPIYIPTTRFIGRLQKIAVVGGSFRETVQYWTAHKADGSKAGLARGLDSRDAPHSAKSVADARAKEKPAAKVAEKKAAKRAEKAAKAAPKGDDARSIVLVNKAYTFGAEGTARRAAWDACAKAKTVAAYLAAPAGKAKYLARWVAAGAIKLA